MSGLPRINSRNIIAAGIAAVIGYVVVIAAIVWTIAAALKWALN